MTGMRLIKALTGHFTEKLATFLGEGYNLYPSKMRPPEWMAQILVPTKFSNENLINKNLKFDITENVCGLTANFGLIKRGIITNFVAYNNEGEQITSYIPEVTIIRRALVDIRRYYNATYVTLQAKILENDNYYGISPRVLAFALYIDDIMQSTKDMASILREFNIEIVPVLDLNKTINKETKESYSAQSLLSNVPSKGIICTNRQKSLSFLL